MGTATVKFSRGKETYETTFNYTENKQMLDLWAKFRSVENQEYSFFKLEIALRYQPLDTPEQLKWIKSIADSGNYITGEPLGVKGRYVSRDDVLSDGPFIESKEGVSGYDMIWAENINQAVAIAQTCPLVVTGAAVIEVRPVMDIS